MNEKDFVVDKKRDYYHTHPISIIKNLSSIMFLLILPLARGLFVAFTEGTIDSWLRGSYFDITVIMIGIGFAVAVWHEEVYKTDSDGIYIKHGILRKQKFFISDKNMATLIVYIPFYYRLIGAARIIGDTNAGMARTTEFDIIIFKKHLDEFLGNRKKSDSDTDNYMVREYKPLTLYVAIFSAFISNSLAGVILISSFFSQMGNILGEELEERVINTVSVFFEKFANTVPVVFSGIAVAILSGWVIAFLNNLAQYIFFSASRTKDQIVVNLGVFTKRRYYMLFDRINYLDIRQDMLFKIFRLQTTYIYCTGYGKDKKIAPVLIPVGQKDDMLSTIQMIVPEISVKKRKLAPKSLGSIFGYILPPMIFAIIAYLTAFSLIFVMPEWEEVVKLIAFAMSVPFIWICMVKFFDFMTTGIGKSKNSLTLYYSSLFVLHTIVIPMDKITKIVIKQNPFQKISGTCTIVIYSFAENRKRHIIKSISKEESLKFFRMNPII